jgi:hypothetical protein
VTSSTWRSDDNQIGEPNVGRSHPKACPMCDDLTGDCSHKQPLIPERANGKPIGEYSVLAPEDIWGEELIGPAALGIKRRVRLVRGGTYITQEQAREHGLI